MCHVPESSKGVASGRVTRFPVKAIRYAADPATRQVTGIQSYSADKTSAKAIDSMTTPLGILASARN